MIRSSTRSAGRWRCGCRTVPGLPFCIDDEAPALRMQPPAAGEHTDAILAALGYPAERVAQLRAAKAIS
jgi:crotonobetainyl-CoA:carnitine CoA-transferase CaiB-like acyl-CoA transferase